MLLGTHRQIACLMLLAAGGAWADGPPKGPWAFGGVARGADWPTYQHDNARSAKTPERLDPPLAVQWVFRSPHPPARGWPEPEAGEVWSYGVRRISKVRYDDSFPVAAAAGCVYFASSAENRIYCLDAATGRVRWTAYTDAPPRLAPTVSNGRAYVGADDGKVYCLDSSDGRLVWEFQAARGPQRALGHGRLMSLWPVRTGVLIEGTVAYFGAGLFPAEGLRLFAVGAEDGKRIWVNDTFDQAGRANVTPQGYLLAAGDRLIMPSGRVTPVVFSRTDGRQLFAIQGPGALSGGTYALLAGGRLYNGTQVLTAYDLDRTEKDKYGHDVKGPAAFELFEARRIVLDGGTAYLAMASELLAMPQESLLEAAKEVDALRKVRWDRRNQVRTYERLQKELAGAGAEGPRRARLLQEVQEVKPHHDAVAAAERKLSEYLDRACKWRLACEASDSLILAGGVLLAGGEGCVLAVEAASGRKLWTGKVSGAARALAVADGRLLASTTTGDVYCFAKGAAAEGEAPTATAPADPYPQDAAGRVCADTAEEIVRETSIRRGYCLILGGGTGRLARELARRTELTIYVVEPDASKVAQARDLLSRAGLHGARVAVEHAPLAPLPHPPYFANLVVCQEALAGGKLSTPAAEVLRVLRPLGGVAYVGQPPGLDGTGKSPKPGALTDWLKGLQGQDVQISVSGTWARITRGPLKGAGQWSHQYADAGNTGCSGDELAKGPLGVLWFGDPGPRPMIDRHARGPAPLVVSGRMLIEGNAGLLAYDAYNGLPLWQRDIPGAKREHMPVDCANVAATGDAVFVALSDKCLCLDAATGRTLRTYPLPLRKDGRARRWGWLAVAAGTVFGSRTETDRPPRSWPQVSGNASEAVFALDAADGRTRWVYEGQGILHTALAAGDGAVFLVDRALTPEQRAQGIRDRIRDPGDAQAGGASDRRGKPVEPDVRLVVALDAATGRQRWAKPLDLTDCVVAPGGSFRQEGAGGEVSLLYKDSRLALCSAPWNGHFLKEWQAGRFSRRSIIALAADTGKLLWSGHKGYRSRPLIVGDAIFAEPWAHDLRTGGVRMHEHPVTGRTEKWTMWRGYGGCGAVAAAAHALFFRAADTAYWDLQADEGVVALGAHRPNCWVNFVPAGGLALVPEGSSGCDCPYAIQCTVALAPREQARPQAVDPARPVAWAEYPLAAPLVPAKHIAVNLGALGDRRDSGGRLWLHCPNRVHKYGWLGTRFFQADGAGYYRHDTGTQVDDGTAPAWVFASGARGLMQLSIPLVAKGGPAAAYTVRLYFAEPDGLASGRRVFDVSLQGKVVLRGFDPARQAAAPGRGVVREFRGVAATDSLTVDLWPTSDAKDKLPVLCGVEAVREGQ